MISKPKARLVTFLVALFAVGYGLAAYHYALFPSRFVAPVITGLLKGEAARFGNSPPGSVPAGGEGLLEHPADSLSQLGYLSGYEPAPLNAGLVLYDRRRAYEGYNFYTSAHAPEAVLMSMEGKKLHAWRYPYRDDWPEQVPNEPIPEFQQHTEFWRRAALFPNGDVLAIFEGHALLKVDKDSHLLWAYRGGFHHDLDVTDEGRIFVLTRRTNRRHEAMTDREAVIEDFITVLASDGKLIRRVSILDAFLNSPYRDLLLERLPKGPDVMHTNTVEVLQGRLAARSEAFRKGNVLISLRNVDLIAVVDLDRQSVVWASGGNWKMQHQPTVLDNGNLLLFDNQGGVGGHSKVIEFNPFTSETAWVFGRKEEQDFYSMFAGSNQRLPNGNTLITDSTTGRAFEVTPDHQFVWAWVNVNRTGRNRQLVAVLHEMLRYEDDYVTGWLD